MPIKPYVFHEQPLKKPVTGTCATEESRTVFPPIISKEQVQENSPESGIGSKKMKKMNSAPSSPLYDNIDQRQNPQRGRVLLKCGPLGNPLKKRVIEPFKRYSK